jgi:hypothetical protein
MNAKVCPSIAACGIDCGLCPLHHVTAGEGCPGCTAPGPSGVKGRWCAIARCAVRERDFETCADCPEFPCARLDGWDESDSVVSHLNSLANLRAIRDGGLNRFIEQQRSRIELLKLMLAEFDEGRSKGYCCLAATLLPLDELTSGLRQARREVADAGIPVDDRKSQAAILHRVLDGAAGRLGVNLRLRRLPKPSG